MEVTSFKDLNLSHSILSAIEELGFTTLTPVQASCIPLFLSKMKDVSVEAVTGSGKTLAFLIPMFELLQRKAPFRKQDVAALIISPTRELAAQTSEVVDLFLRHIPGFSSILLIGGEPLATDILKMKENGMNIIIATPGRLADLFENNKEVKLASSVKALEMLILDEADRLLDMGFETTLNTILSYLPKQRQTGLFSATQTKYMEDLLRAGLRNPVCISVKEKGADVSYDNKTPSSLSNFYMVCDEDKKLSILLNFLKSQQNGKHMVFFSTCASVEYFSYVLSLFIRHLQVMSIHGKMKKKRHKIFSEFRNSENAVICCTDVMARGVDIPDVNWVVQFDPPSSASSFVHRCGRTARIGKVGHALVLLLHNEETFVNFLEVNQKVTLEKMDTLQVTDINPKIRKLAMKNREIFEKGIRAFVSHIRFYTKHECNLLFRVKDLDLAMLANGYALLKLPKMPELKNKDVSNFIATDTEYDAIPYLNKHREKQRNVNLEEFKKKMLDRRPPPEKKEPWSRSKKLEEKKKLRKHNKRKAAMDDEDLNELARDTRLLKKLKQQKITEKEFEAKFIPEIEDA